MTSAPLDLAFLQEWIGRASEAEDIVTPRLIAEYRATFEAHLADTPADEAPLGLHWCLAPPVTPMSELGADGHAAKGGFLPPVPLPRRMWAGGEVETHAPLHAGDTVTKRSVVESVSLKQGRSGPLCFVAVRHTFSTVRGIALSERHDIVYRGADAASPGQTRPSQTQAGKSMPQEDQPADRTWEVETSPVLLFRYSAMTFNGHRIHYDRPYVTDVEGYPGLIVHGPIQATVCLNMAATLAGRTPRLFRFRNVSPLFAGGSFRVTGARGADGTITCATRSAERVCMEGESPA